MSKRYAPFHPSCTTMLHGGDYNPDQWIATPGIWDEDMRLMRLAGCNAASVGIFSWAALEPEEGRFTFDWLDTIMDKIAANNGHTILATPSGSKPAWLSRAYPESCRVNEDGSRQRHGGRHNHCRTSPAYREKCRTINTKLAERYKDHPALVLWHVSNEYNGGDCYCDLCIEAFQKWLRSKYQTIENLNSAYWSSFWSHIFPDFDYVFPTDKGIHALMMDWERFKTHQTIDFFKDESGPLRAIAPNVPVTTNFMNLSDTLDYWAFSKAVDVVSWDSYPNWHEFEDELGAAIQNAFANDQCRSMKHGKPWLLMESVPSIPTRDRVKKRKEPGMHLLSSIQPVAHGGDAVLYFQWRKSRGCMEKFHGAVVDHVGHEHTREFREVAEVGNALAKLREVVGTSVSPQVAVVMDWENSWAINEGAHVYHGDNIKYRKDCHAHYAPFWHMGIPTDVIDQDCDLSPYRLVAAPFSYMLRPGFAERIMKFVADGGTLVMTYWSGVVDHTDLCYLGGVPGDGLREVFGIWEEETQSYFPHESVRISAANGTPLSGDYKAVDICSVIHTEGAKVLATYSDQYFSGTPAVTVNAYGKGKAYYVAARTTGNLLSDLYGSIVKDLGISSVIDAELPHGVTAQLREDGNTQYVFLLNFNDHAAEVALPQRYFDMLQGKDVSGKIALAKYGVCILRSEKA